MLDELLRGSLQDAERRRAEKPLREVEKAALDAPAALDVPAAFAPRDTVHIIGEVKRASPSRGDLADIPDPARLAAEYEAGGVSAISVLTEERKFKGSLRDLEDVRERVSVPVLRKDFIGEEYQLLEQRAAGADIALLIVAALDQKTLRRLFRFVTDLGMTALVETHDEREIDRAVDLEAQLIGVNARNLTTFELDRELFGRNRHRIPAGVTTVAESAVLEPADVRRYREAGADVVLIGEALVTGDPAETVHSFLEASRV